MQSAESFQQVSVIHTPPSIMNNQYENSVDSDVLMEDSMDAPPSVGSGDIPQSALATPLGPKKCKGSRRALVTGYVLYSGDVRKAIAASNPDCNFGEVSRIVGNEWRKLSASEKAAWEERAARINEESMKNNCDDPASPGPPPVYDLIFECQWENCDWQFEDLADAIDHAVGDSHGHIYQYFANLTAQIPNPQDIEYQCQWRGCTRTRKTIPPFPSVQRLARHVKEVHMLKSTGRTINAEHKSKHFMPSRKAAMKQVMASAPPPPIPHGISMHAASAVTGMPVNHSRSTPSPLSHNGGILPGANGRIPEPLFVTVPPRTQRLLHSEAYIKYIEGLTPDNRNISNWEKQLKASESSIEPPTDPQRLPIQWLNNRNGNHGNILNALWTLRDFMFRDALGISKHL